MPTARATQVANAVVAVLQTIDNTVTPSKWNTKKPIMVVHGVDFEAANTRPSVLVHVDGQDARIGGLRHRFSARVRMHCAADSLVALNDLMADVLVAMNDVEDQVPPLGGLVLDPYTDAEVTTDGTRGGVTTGTVDVGMQWEWSHGAA